MVAAGGGGGRGGRRGGVGVAFWRLGVIGRGVVGGSRGGKIKTVLQIVAIGLYILPVQVGWLRSAAMAAAVAVTLVSGADYVLRALRLRRAASGHPAGLGGGRPAGPGGGT